MNILLPFFSSEIFPYNLRYSAQTQTRVLIDLSHSPVSDEHTVLLLWPVGPGDGRNLLLIS